MPHWPWTDSADPDCRCEPTVDDDRLVVDAAPCPGGGDLETEPACRATVVAAMGDSPVETVLTRQNGRERAYEDGAAALLSAAGRFAERAAFHDERLARLARSDPLRAAREATGRAGPVSDIAAETGLAAGADRADDYGDALRLFAGPTISQFRVAVRPPPGAQLVAERETTTGAVVRIYERSEAAVPQYHVEPVEERFDADSLATLAAAHDRLASGVVSGADAPHRAVRRVADSDQPVERLGAVLAKHTSGLGTFEDLFADPDVSDVFASAPLEDNRLSVRVDGERMRTNVRLTDEGARGLASKLRRDSGRSFSRASPTIDATADADGRRVRVAGVTEPVSDGLAFVFRAHDRTAWTLPALVANGTLPADAAALLSLAVERGASMLVAGARGAGKTTLLGALLWELPPAVRTLTIEDTPELPVEALQSSGRDVQPLLTSTGTGPGLAPEDALRTALRLGSGALVVGEIRGEEAGVLYEAMRVGANASAVLGTVHGDGGDAVRERVVSDLGVPASSFRATDLVVTVEPVQTDGDTDRRLGAVEEVVTADGATHFEPLFRNTAEGITPTGRIERGNSELVASLAGPDGSYADVRSTLRSRAATIDRLAASGRTSPDEVTTAVAERTA